MAFMQPQIIKQRWLSIDGPNGSEYIPAEFVREPSLNGFAEDKRKAFAECAEYKDYVFEQAKDYRENSAYWELAFVDGFGARFSAPGYIDATDWSVFETEAEAVKHLLDQHLDDNPQAKVTFSAQFEGRSIEGAVVNPGDWFGKTWLLSVGDIDPTFYVVEADNVSDAIDELAESKEFGDCIRIKPEDFGDYGTRFHKGDDFNGRILEADCYVNLRGEIVADELNEAHYAGDGTPYDDSFVRIHGAEGIANGKGMPFPCTYHVEDFGEVSPLVFAS